MSSQAIAGAAAAVPATPTAGGLAARIPIPARLPDRYDGEPLRHLSASSYALWLSCPDAWRRRYIEGERPPTTGSMFLGSRVDDALSAYYRRILEHGDRLALDQVLDLYRELWHELEAEQDDRGIHWEDELPDPAAFALGRQAIELAIAELVPHLGDPVPLLAQLSSLAAEQWLLRSRKALLRTCGSVAGMMKGCVGRCSGVPAHRVLRVPGDAQLA